MRRNETNNGKKGGLLKGKPHYDENGKSLGGIKAIVTDSNAPVELEGGEVIINKHASKKYWKELSKINQSAGNGVPINNPNGGSDEDPEEYKEGGRIIDFNPNHLPNKRILTYAKKIKSEYPKVWDLGGNIFGNEAFKNLQRVSERGYWLESEKWMYIKWRSFVARHTHDFRIKGVIAMLKWVDKVDKGWDYMKSLIEAEIEKKYPSKMEKGGELVSELDYGEIFVTKNKLKSGAELFDAYLVVDKTNPFVSEFKNRAIYCLKFSKNKDGKWHFYNVAVGFTKEEFNEIKNNSIKSTIENNSLLVGTEKKVIYELLKFEINYLISKDYVLSPLFVDKYGVTYSVDKIDDDFYVVNESFTKRGKLVENNNSLDSYAILGGNLFKQINNLYKKAKETKMEKGGIFGDIFSISDAQQFKQVITTYNELSEKFGVENYVLNHNENSIVFLLPKNNNNFDLLKLQKYVDSLSDRGFNVFDKTKNKNITLQNDNSESGKYVYFKLKLSEIVKYSKGGNLIKRKDGSYSKRGLWDNIRANIGSGKKPTKQILEQEEKIKSKMSKGGGVGSVVEAKAKTYTINDYDLTIAERWLTEWQYDIWVKRGRTKEQIDRDIENAKKEIKNLQEKTPFTTWYIEIPKGKYSFKIGNATYNITKSLADLDTQGWKAKNWKKTIYEIVKADDVFSPFDKFILSKRSEKKEDIQNQLNYSFKNLIQQDIDKKYLPNEGKMEEGGLILPKLVDNDYALTKDNSFEFTSDLAKALNLRKVSYNKINNTIIRIKDHNPIWTNFREDLDDNLNIEKVVNVSVLSKYADNYHESQVAMSLEEMEDEYPNVKFENIPIEKGTYLNDAIKLVALDIDQNAYEELLGTKMKRGGEIKNNYLNNDIIVYHEKQGNWFVNKNTIYCWLYEDSDAKEKVESGEYDFVLFPHASLSMSMQKGFIPPLLRIWTKKYQDKHKGSTKLIGIIEAEYDDVNNKLYILMMTTKPKLQGKGIMSYMIKNLREAYNLKQEDIIFVDTTKEGKKFEQAKHYKNGGLLSDENYGKLKDFDNRIFIHETTEENAKSILKNGFKNPNTKVITRGIYTIPIQWKDEKLHENGFEVQFTLKKGSKIFWTDSDRPTDFYLGFGNKFYEKLYNQLNKGSISARKLVEMKSDKWNEANEFFCRKIEKWLKENDYCGVQQGGEIVITDLSKIENIKLFDRKYGKGGELAMGVKSEKEHIDTAKKLYKHEITPEQSARVIAQDHLKENPRYYSDLKKVEDEAFTCEIIKNGERQIDAKSIAKLTKCINTLPQTKELNSVDGKYTDERVELHKKIIKEAKTGVTCITKGKPIAVLMGGSPASGKTTFLKKYRPYLLQNNLFKVDADEVRAKLPEYKGWNASQTHKETGDIVKTLISDRNIGIPCLFDFIYDGTMTGVEKYESLIQFLKKEGYEIFIVFMGNVSKEVVKERALKRYQKSGRFVPMEVLDDFFKTGESTLNQLKNKVDGYIVVDASSPTYEIMEEGGKRLPNKRIYEKLGEPIKLAKGGKVKSNNKLGDCYQSAGNMVMDFRGNGNDEIDFIGTPYLVHAEVSGQGEIEGIRYGHAFIVDDVFVYDYSNKRKIMLPKSIYYRVGKIIEKKPIFYKYTFEEAMKKMRETMNYGPWDLKTTSGL